VMLTRARVACCVVGDARTMLESPHWRAFHRHVAAEGGVIDVPSPVTDVFSLKAQAPTAALSDD
jgi:superfamily I DNA and/or RNA helicase